MELFYIWNVYIWNLYLIISLVFGYRWNIRLICDDIVDAEEADRRLCLICYSVGLTYVQKSEKIWLT